MRFSAAQLLTEAQAKRQQAAARVAALEGRKKTCDIRLRAKGERVLLRLLLDRLATDAAFKAAQLDQMTAAGLKPDDYAAAIYLLKPNSQIS